MQKTTQTTTPTVAKVIKYPVIELKDKGELIIPENVQKRIDMLHALVGKTEWCGFITYDKTEGSINDPSTYKAVVKDIYPMNIGSEAYTESDNHASELLKMDERIPSYFMSKTGLIHTHQSMKAFFSGTDIQELHNNVDKYDGDSYYLSLIVNFNKEYVAKIVKLVDIPANKAVYNESGTEHTMEFPSQKVMIMFDLNVIIEEEPFAWNDDMMQTRIDELKAEVEAKKAAAVTKPLSIVFGDRNSVGDWKPGTQGTLEFVERNKKSTNEYATFLRMCLQCQDTPTKEIGQLLIEMTKLNPDDFDERLDEIGQYAFINAFNAFGENNMCEGINKTKGILKTYLGAPKWRSEVEHLVEVFENCAEDLAVYEINELEVIQG